MREKTVSMSGRVMFVDLGEDEGVRERLEQQAANTLAEERKKASRVAQILREHGIEMDIYGDYESFVTMKYKGEVILDREDAFTLYMTSRCRFEVDEHVWFPQGEEGPCLDEIS